MRLLYGLILALTFGIVAGSQAGADPVLYVDDVRTLSAIEDAGHDFGTAFGETGAFTLKDLHDRSAAWRTFVATVAGDVKVLRDDMKRGDRDLREVTDDNIGRVMDMRWLSSSASRMRLVGIVNRMDKADVHAKAGETSCGEVRFLYRLAYAFRSKGKRFASRMPFSVNVVHTIPRDAGGSCSDAASGWTIDPTPQALLAGPLAQGRVSLRQIELNAQIVRLPAGLETSFGGQAAYLMRVFARDGDRLVERPLENTPDAAAITSSADMKKDLLAFLAENAADIDAGVFRLPDQLSARKAISWSTFGSIRRGNRAWSAVLAPGELDADAMSGNSVFRTPAALLERLDNSTCQGCHQSGATAGFHFIGRDGDDASPLNRIEVGFSPHFSAELPRRAAWVAATTEGREPPRFRPLSSAPPADWTAIAPVYAAATVGQPCMPENAGFADHGWGCAAGLQCRVIARSDGSDTPMAQCLLPDNSKQMFSGHPCIEGEVVTDPAQPFNDRYRIGARFTAKDEKVSRTGYNCRPPVIGVPGGLAYRGCTDADRAFKAFRAGAPMPYEICGLVGGKAFDACAASNAFDGCLGASTVRGNRQACSADRMCREDYMCQALPPDTPGIGKVRGIGFCSPTYFVFQMRIDNHPTPW